MTTTTATRTVLMIDDDADFAASVRALLEAEGYDFVHAESGRLGLEKVREIRPDLILLDVMMESTDEGYGVNQAIKYRPDFEAFHDTPIIMISSIDESPDERFGRSEEVAMIRPDRYLTKPLDLPVFLATVRRLTKRG